MVVMGGGGGRRVDRTCTRTRLSCIVVHVGAVYIYVARCRLFMD